MDQLQNWLLVRVFHPDKPNLSNPLIGLSDKDKADFHWRLSIEIRYVGQIRAQKVYTMSRSRMRCAYQAGID